MDKPEPEIVKYSTFVEDFKNTKVSKVDIYNYGDIDLTYETPNGELRATKGPIGLNQDNLLLHVLSKEEIPFVAHEFKYDHNNSKFEWLQLSSLLVFIIPVAMCVVISKQAHTINKLGEVINNLTKNSA